MRWLRRTGQILLHVEDSPSRVALAFALGVFIAFSPLLGIHTGLAIAIALAFRLNKVAILVGAWTNNPWTIAPMYTAGTLLGCFVLGVSPASLGEIDWSPPRAGVLRVPAPPASARCSCPSSWATCPRRGAGLVSFLVLRFLLARRKRAAAPSSSDRA